MLSRSLCFKHIGLLTCMVDLSNAPAFSKAQIQDLIRILEFDHLAVNLGSNGGLITVEIITLSNTNILTESNCRIYLHYHRVLWITRDNCKPLRTSIVQKYTCLRTPYSIKQKVVINFFLTMSKSVNVSLLHVIIISRSVIWVFAHMLISVFPCINKIKRLSISIELISISFTLAFQPCEWRMRIRMH